MRLSLRDRRLIKEIAEDAQIPFAEVRKAILSYFASIVSASLKLPFDNPQRLYSKAAFLEHSFVVNIPYIGRIGPVYSLYLKWRKNEAENYEKVLRHKVRQVYSRALIEEEAQKALKGQKVNEKLLKERIPRGKYNRVWLMDSGGKRRAARQVIVKTKDK